MVARPGTLQASFNAGELSEAVWGRTDLKQFYAGASLMQNAEPVPQGGFREAPGSVDVGLVRGPLAEIPGSLATALGPWTVPGVVATLNFASTQLVEAVDVLGFSASVTVLGALAVETSPDGVGWAAIGPLLNAFPFETRTRRLALAPGAARLARFVRLRLLAAPPSGVTFTLAGFVAQQETALGDSGRLVSYAASVEDAFHVVLSQNNADFWKGDVYCGAAATPATAAQLPNISVEQRQESLFLYSPEFAPWRIVRRDSDFDWESSLVPWKNVPLVDYGLTYANVTPDQWALNFTFTNIGAALLVLQVNGEDAAAVQMANVANWAQFALDIKASLEGTPSVEPGLTVTQTNTSAAGQVLVTFSGGVNPGQKFAISARIDNVATAAVTTVRLSPGDPGGEAIMSDARGWPAVGSFYQDRLFLAGFRSEPAGLLGSVTGEYFDLNTRIENAAGALLVRLDTKGAERVQYLINARHLVLLTNEGEYFVTDRAISRAQPPNVAKCSSNGAAAGVTPVENEGAIIYCNRARKQLIEMKYSDATQIYESVPISLMADHICRDMITMALQRSSTSTDADRLWIVRTDGLLVCGVMIRNQEITAFTRWQTAGSVRAVTVDAQNRVYVLVSRAVSPTQSRLVHERLDDTALLQQARTFTSATPLAQLTGLSQLEGQTVWAICDGYAEGPFTVQGGVLALPTPARQVTVGRWARPIVRTLPLPRLIGERTQLARPVRVHTVRARLNASDAIAIGANGQPAREIPLMRAGDVSDQPQPLVSREVTITGLQGYSADGIVEITQARPGRIRVRDITVEART